VAQLASFSAAESALLQHARPESDVDL
jgi:hypothetical protein